MMQLELIKNFFPCRNKRKRLISKIYAETLNIHNLGELKNEVFKTLETVDLNKKKRDFEHLLFNKRNSERILSVGEFFQDLK